MTSLATSGYIGSSLYVITSHFQVVPTRANIFLQALLQVLGVKARPQSPSSRCRPVPYVECHIHTSSRHSFSIRWSGSHPSWFRWQFDVSHPASHQVDSLLGCLRARLTMEKTPNFDWAPDNPKGCIRWVLRGSAPWSSSFTPLAQLALSTFYLVRNLSQDWPTIVLSKAGRIFYLTAILVGQRVWWEVLQGQ